MADPNLTKMNSHLTSSHLSNSAARIAARFTHHSHHASRAAAYFALHSRSAARAAARVASCSHSAARAAACIAPLVVACGSLLFIFANSIACFFYSSGCCSTDPLLACATPPFSRGRLRASLIFANSGIPQTKCFFRSQGCCSTDPLFARAAPLSTILASSSNPSAKAPLAVAPWPARAILVAVTSLVLAASAPTVGSSLRVSPSP